MIWLSEKRDVFTQNFLDPIRGKLYFQRVLFSGGITVPASRLEQLLAHHKILNKRDLPGPDADDPNVPGIEAEDL